MYLPAARGVAQGNADVGNAVVRPAPCNRSVTSGSDRRLPRESPVSPDGESALTPVSISVSGNHTIWYRGRAMKNSLIVVSVILVVSGSALASTIAVYPPRYSGELSVEQILEGSYSREFSASGENFVTDELVGGLRAERYDDELAPMGIIDMLSSSRGQAADAVWMGGEISATAVARYAGYSQRFGFDRGDGFEVLFNVSGSQMNVTGEGSVDLTGDTWRWTRSDANGSNSFSSDSSQNSDGLDHMVTYEIIGLDRPGRTWMLFWEDIAGPHTSNGGSSDRDFNDLAVEVYAVPEPASLALMILGVVAGVRRYRVLA